jgi:hypothetical protein
VYARADWRDIALEAIDRQSALLPKAPEAAPALLLAHLVAAHGSDLALPVGAGAEALIAAARAEFAPLVTLVVGEPGSVPVLVGRDAGSAYLCQHGACALPARTVETLRAQMGAESPAAARH